MQGNLEFPRRVTSPLVVAGDSIGIRRLDRSQEIDAHEIPAVVRLAKTLDHAVGQLDWPQERKQGLPDVLLVRARLTWA